MFESEGLFRVWRYTVSHLCLVIRSTPDESNPLSVALWFDGVRYLRLATNYRSIRVAAASDADVEGVPESLRYLPDGQPLLALSINGDGEAPGLVVCERATARRSAWGPTQREEPPAEELWVYRMELPRRATEQAKNGAVVLPDDC